MEQNSSSTSTLKSNVTKSTYPDVPGYKQMPTV